jgi:hypothetical protein
MASNNVQDFVFSKVHGLNPANVRANAARLKVAVPNTVPRTTSVPPTTVNSSLASPEPRHRSSSPAVRQSSGGLSHAFGHQNRRSVAGSSAFTSDLASDGILSDQIDRFAGSELNESTDTVVTEANYQDEQEHFGGQHQHVQYSQGDQQDIRQHLQQGLRESSYGEDYEDNELPHHVTAPPSMFSSAAPASAPAQQYSQESSAYTPVPEGLVGIGVNRHHTPQPQPQQTDHTNHSAHARAQRFSSRHDTNGIAQIVPQTQSLNLREEVHIQPQLSQMQYGHQNLGLQSHFQGHHDPYAASELDGDTESVILGEENHVHNAQQTNGNYFNPNQMNANAAQPQQTEIRETPAEQDVQIDKKRLFATAFEDLVTEPFDTQDVDDSIIANLSERLKDLVGIHKREEQNEFFGTLTIEQWEKAGEWLTEQQVDLSKRFVAARHERRKLSEKYESMIAERHAAVEKGKRAVDKGLEELRGSSTKMLRGKSPLVK